MCFGMDCPNEITSGPRIGECRGGYCPPIGEICNICGADTESDSPVCDQCLELFKDGEEI